MRQLFGLLMALLIAGGMTAAFSLSFGTMAEAAEAPSPPPLLQRDDDVVTSDPLPTVQIDNGYVWAQETIGSTVYAVGDFDNARAPLAAPGTQLTPRSNILAYDISTGSLLPFAPQVNGVIKAVAASPDGSRIYIGGSFTSVNGEARWSIAALDAVTGQLVAGFRPAVGGSGVYALVAHGSMVYAGGLFTQGNGVARKNAAAFSASNGALMPWAPQTDLQIDAMVADPGGEKIILGGRFSEVNGNTSMRGTAAIDTQTGAVDAEWALPQTVKNGRGSGGSAGKAGIFALAADQDAVYGTGWVFADVTTGNLEGTFAAEADSGDVRWIADCLGDHYGVYSTGTTVYTTSHTHACSTMGLHPEQSPRNYRYVEAYTADARGALGHNPHAGGTYQDWAGTPAPSAYAWYPDFFTGTTSGLGQAGLSITGVGDIISVAGEFVGVNNQRYEGIVRFSTNPPQGAKDGPRIAGAGWKPTANSVIPGRVRVSIPGNWDRDDLDLTYELRRAGTSSPVDVTTVPSTWWEQPSVVLEDTTAPAGSTPSYTVVVRDGDGNAVTSQSVTTTVAAGIASEYVTAVIDDAPQLYYPLGDTMEDWAGANPAVAGSGVSPGAPGIENSSTGFSDFSGTSSGRVATSARMAVPAEFSTELWFRTTTSRGGKLIGYGSSSSGDSGSYDRHVYMSNSGEIIFGVYPGSAQTIQSASGYNDGEWHHVVAAQSSDGIQLFVDGALVAENDAVTSAQRYSGYWRIGGDNLNGWPNAPRSFYFDGAIDEAAIYDRALELSEVSTHYGIGKGFEAPTASFSATADELEVAVDAQDSTPNGDAAIAEYRWDFGDGSPEATGVAATHAYSTSGTYTVTLTVVDSNGLIATSVQTVNVLGPNLAPTARIETSVAGLTVTADGAGSTDPDGEIVSYEWDWGDGETSSGPVDSHQYAEAGFYTVTLTVTDDRGGAAETAERVTVTHSDPTAQFTASTSGLIADVDASGSSAADGASLTYSWDWGDGTTSAAGPTASHSYSDDGEYTITLTVTDSYGSTAETTHSVVVTSEEFVGSDSFERSVASGWGSADVGGAWTSTGWKSAAMSVGDGVGSMVLAPGAGRDMVLAGTSLSDSSTSMAYTLDGGPSTGALYFGAKSRYGAGGHAYRSLAWHRADGSLWLVIQRDESVLAVLPTSMRWVEGDSFRLRTEVVGEDSATIRMKVWVDGAAEPAGWQLETTDTSAEALTAAGASSVYLYRSGSSSGQNPIRVDDYRLQDLGVPGEPVENLAPVAGFTSSVSGLDVSVDGAASSDEDGSIVSYAWDFGDGATATGVTASHEYAEAGTYDVSLTVTDDEGATHGVTQSVTVENITSDGFVGSDSFERSVASGWGSADVGGAWTSTGWKSAAMSVGDGVGSMVLAPGAGRDMVLAGTSLSDSSTSMAYTLDGGPSTGALYFGAKSRYGAGGHAYRSLAWHRADGSLWLVIQRDESVLAVLPTSMRWVEGDSFRLRTEVVGEDSATIRMKVWVDGAAEPAGWQLETTDTSAEALTAAGASSVYLYRSGSSSGQNPIRVDDYRLSDTSEPAAAPRRMAAAPAGDQVVPENPETVGSSDDSDDARPEPQEERDSESVDGRESNDSPSAEAGTDTAEDPQSDEAVDPDAGSEDADPAEDSAGDEAAAPSQDEADGAGTADEAAPGSSDGADPESAEEEASPAPEEEEGSLPADEEAEPAEPATDDTQETEEEPMPEDAEQETFDPVSDGFERSVESGWGDLPEGESWTAVNGSEASLSVDEGAGRMELQPGTSGTALLDESLTGDSITELTFRVDEEGELSGAAVGAVVGTGGDSIYSVDAVVHPDRTIWLQVDHGDDTVAKLQLEGLEYEPGSSYTLSVSVVADGEPMIAAKLWQHGSAEPTDWQLVVDEDDLPDPLAERRLGVTAGRADDAHGSATVQVEEFTVSPQG
ncbi:PKD domain-containing protein [Brachybacterium paraconglomeratum]|uniref:PKD domain-containing protein n=1 Tax=Brachybacterium paraconglomeratum TaxID=173362 RepID=UPI003879F6D6